MENLVRSVLEVVGRFKVVRPDRTERMKVQATVLKVPSVRRLLKRRTDLVVEGMREVGEEKGERLEGDFDVKNVALATRRRSRWRKLLVF